MNKINKEIINNLGKTIAQLIEENKKLKLDNEALKKQLSLNIVSNRRELLISFLKYLRIRDIANTKKENIGVRVDLFLKRNL
ncbi:MULTISPECIES: hypothetical protein [unclassified Polaribacter]|uniref:hypothetical protein n=1 Tax=unclassified Polaribacter TaxID=196858 RepID=UPI0011BE5D3C|nr:MULTISPECIES: hypothetical protein [unclassified Polaribacter]TXD46475.1 hypothetical protein ES043_18425 [Polaribacter sp. IC063]TXD54722.1 hypothetical protein ES044_18355 [Polaribacter sp. IC066]